MEENCSRIDPSAYRYARFKSRQLAGTHGFLHDDAEDIEHELLLDCLKRSGACDARRSSQQTFVRLVIDHRIATLIDSQKAACRDYRLCQESLDNPVAARDGSPLVLSDLIREGGCQFPCRTPESWWQLRADLGQVLDQMPVELSHICRLIIDGEGAVDIVARTGTSRPTLYRRLGQVRSLFERAGLRRYLT